MYEFPYYFNYVDWVLYYFDCSAIQSPKSKREKEQKYRGNAYPENALLEGKGEVKLRAFHRRPKNFIVTDVARRGHCECT
jgi:hypothetical protein